MCTANLSVRVLEVFFFKRRAAVTQGCAEKFFGWQCLTHEARIVSPHFHWTALCGCSTRGARGESDGRNFNIVYLLT